MKGSTLQAAAVARLTIVAGVEVGSGRALIKLLERSKAPLVLTSWLQDVGFSARCVFVSFVDGEGWERRSKTDKVSPPLLGILLVYVAAAGREGCIVDEDVGVAKVLFDLGKQFGHRNSIRNVGGYRECLNGRVDLADAGLDGGKLLGAGGHQNNGLGSGLCKGRNNALYFSTRWHRD